MSELGLVAAGKRNIRQGYNFDKYFPSPQVKDEIIKRNGTVKDTVMLMEQIVRSTLTDTAQIAPLLRGKTVYETAGNIWKFLYNHVQYRLDKPGVEELRRPSRSWFDRKAGVDCDDFAIMASSLLFNNGIAHKFRITKYHAEWQHVYVTIPVSSGKEIIIDCVLDKFDYEKPYTEKFDHKMEIINGIGLPIAYLSGLGEIEEAYTLSSLLGMDDSGLLGIITGADLEVTFEGLSGLGFTGKDLEKIALDKIYDHLIRTRDYIIKNPHSVITSGGASTHLKMLNYAIDNWNTPNRDAALSVLEREEEKWNNKSGVSGFDDVELNSLGLGKPFFKKLWSGVKSAVNTVKQTAVKIGKTVVKAASTVGKAIAKGITKVIKAVAEYNPLSIAARAGFLTAMRINIFQFAKKIAPGYLSLSEAKAKGFNEMQWNKGVKALAKAKHVYTKVLYGNESKLNDAIRKGAGLSGLDYADELHGLGEPVTLSIIAAATPLLAIAEALSGSDDILGSVEESFGSVDGLGCGTSRKCLMSGLGDNDAEQVAKSGGEKKGLLSRFVGLIKSWFSKKKDEGTDYAKQQVTAQDNDTTPVPADATNPDGTTALTTTNYSDTNAPNTSPGIIAKATQFIKDNPGKTALGAAGIGVVGWLIFKPKKRSGGLTGTKRGNQLRYLKSITLK